METNLIGKCGLYCGACSIYRAERDDLELRTKIATNSNCSCDQVKCNGCGDLTPSCWGYGCKIVVCLRTKELNYCFECDEYQNNNCMKHQKLAKSYSEVGVDLRRNLERIKNGETLDWLKDSKNKFQCPNCHHPHSAWSTICSHCKNELK